MPHNATIPESQAALLPKGDLDMAASLLLNAEDKLLVTNKMLRILTSWTPEEDEDCESLHLLAYTCFNQFNEALDGVMTARQLLLSPGSKRWAVDARNAA